MPTALLCLDLGNSRLKGLLWQDGRASAHFTLPAQAGPPDWERVLAGPLAAAGRVALASVRPAAAAQLAAWLAARGPRCWQLASTMPLPFATALGDRRTLGADRLCNAAAAWVEPLAPALLIDAGTAITVDLIDPAGCYLGGAILPGPELMLAALAGGTAQLPRVQAAWPAQPWGGDTAEALAAGALWGSLAAVEGLVARRRREWPGAVAVLTGGLAPALAARWQEGVARLEPDWTLRGLAALALAAADGPVAGEARWENEGGQ
jgi:type III pantothenate kinase